MNTMLLDNRPSYSTFRWFSLKIPPSVSNRNWFCKKKKKFMYSNYSTMLQKLSKCEVKAWLCWNLIIFRQSYLTWNEISVNSDGPKMLIFTILEVLNFDFSKFEQLSRPKFTKILSSESLQLPKMTFLDSLNSSKFDFAKIGVTIKLSSFNKVKP